MDDNFIFLNYIVSWELISYDENVVEVTMILDIEGNRNNNVDKFKAYVFNTDYGVFWAKTVEVYQDDIYVDSQSYEYDMDDETIEVIFPLEKDISKGEVSTIKIKYSLMNTVCSRGSNSDKVLVQASWASLFEYAPDIIEYDLFLPNFNNRSDSRLTCSPRTNMATSMEFDNVTALYVPYESIVIGTGSDLFTEVNFEFNKELFNGDLTECQTADLYEFEIQSGGIFLGITLLLFVSLTLVVVIYSLIRSNESDDGYFRNIFRTNFLFSSSRADIVVAPTSNERTVQAAYVSTRAETDIIFQEEGHIQHITL